MTGHEHARGEKAEGAKKAKKKDLSPENEAKQKVELASVDIKCLLKRRKSSIEELHQENKKTKLFQLLLMESTLSTSRKKMTAWPLEKVMESWKKDGQLTDSSTGS